MALTVSPCSPPQPVPPSGAKPTGGRTGKGNEKGDDAAPAERKKPARAEAVDTFAAVRALLCVLGTALHELGPRAGPQALEAA